MSLISQSEKDYYESIMSQVAQTFERNITLHLEPTKVVISTDPNFSRFGLDNNSVENQPVQYTIPARIHYMNDQDYRSVDFLQGGALDEAQLKLKQSFGLVKIKIPSSGEVLFKDAKIIELDGFLFNIKSSAKKHGLFFGNYSTYILERAQ